MKINAKFLSILVALLVCLSASSAFAEDKKGCSSTDAPIESVASILLGTLGLVALRRQK